MNINDMIKEVLYSEKAIEQKVKEAAKAIENDYKDKNPMMVCVLTGSFIFMSDLVRNINLPIDINFISASSYGTNMVSSGKVKINKLKDFDVKGRDVIIVEDILDTGRTLKAVRDCFMQEGAKSVAVCSLLIKPERAVESVKVDYYCFEIPNEFVVGYGLDFKYKFRNLPYIGILKEECYE